MAAVVTTALPGSILTMLAPRLRHRRALARAAARALFRLAGIPLRVTGLNRFRAGPSVVVANHASYLDGIVLMAALPPRFTFLIKGEMSGVPFIGLLLRRLGMAFVSRSDPRAASGAATRLVRAAKNGNAIGVFPEGTFLRQPGLRDFQLGAFVAAARGNLPVVPLVIRGTRDILPAGSRFPRAGRINVTLLEPVTAEAPGRDGAEWLRAAARQSILRDCGEADAARPMMRSASASRG